MIKDLTLAPYLEQVSYVRLPTSWLYDDLEGTILHEAVCNLVDRYLQTSSSSPLSTIVALDRLTLHYCYQDWIFEDYPSYCSNLLSVVHLCSWVFILFAMEIQSGVNK